MRRSVTVVGAPSSAAGYAPGQELAPGALRDAGLLTALRHAGLDTVDAGDVRPWRWQPDSVRHDAQNLAAVVETVGLVAERVRAVRDAGRTALVLGGDCTVGIGTVDGCLAAGDAVGVAYLNMHPDLNVPSSVKDGALDWMGMAHLLDVAGAESALAGVGPRRPLLHPGDVRFLGYEPSQMRPFETQTFNALALRGTPADRLAEDPEGVAATVLTELERRADAIVVHLDVDVVEFVDLPLSENTGRNIGLTFAVAMRALGALLRTPRLAALTITELNPQHGASDGATLRTFVAHLAGCLAPSGRSAS